MKSALANDKWDPPKVVPHEDIVGFDSDLRALVTNCAMFTMSHRCYNTTQLFEAETRLVVLRTYSEVIFYTRMEKCALVNSKKPAQFSSST